MKEFVFILVCALIGASVITAQWFGQADINALEAEVVQAKNLTQQHLNGNEEAGVWILEQAELGRMPYTMALAYLESTDGRYKLRDEMIWAQLHTTNSLESAIVLKQFGYLFDTAALGLFIRDSMDENGDLDSNALTAMRTVTFSKEQLDVIRECREKMAYRMRPDNDLYSYRAASHWLEKITGQKGYCFDGVKK